ncbi:MAG: FAD-dependent oxidoreductase [Candidatus Omnitrophica bacterium]|nr:FAD-dependent oxidoreductase [Candidatus Omnitrophota bacterium]
MLFKELQERAKKDWEEIKQSEPLIISVGAATCGRSAGALSVLQAFKDELSARRIRARIIEVGCIGLCYAEPIVTITKSGHPGICYGNITPLKVIELIEGYIVNDRVLADYALGTIGEGSIDSVPCLFQTPVLKPQVRRIMSNFGSIDPTNINHYIASGGYSGLVKALKMKPGQIINELKKSGLRGRGGAGFPTWQKWQFCLNAKGRHRYIICNADEGDPGAFMNRSLLESDPHSVLEGLLIAGYTIGAEKGYIYCRAEYPLALERLKIALKETEKSMLLGNNICDSRFNFHIEIKQGAGAFVCGEETALIASIEGKRGMPNPRPPFPAVSGLWGEPTIINNVETLASVASIFKNNADWFGQYGTQKSKGTKTFALAGKVKYTGLIEVPLGVTLRQVIYEIGGGIQNDKKFKAVQTGGPSGGCLPASLLDNPVDYESLTQAGSIMGSGGMVVMDEDTCMVDIARYFLDFTQKESCGKCAPCRLGTKQMLDILNDITQGKSRSEDIDLLLELAEGIKAGSLCGLGQTAPNTVLTTIRYFRDEYEAHIKHKRCPAVVCKEIISSPCQHVCPVDTEAALYISLIAQGRFREAWDIIRKDNPLPSICGRVCHHPCESKCLSGKWGDPIAIRALKRFVTDYALKTGIYHPTEKRRVDKEEKVAIIGSGPAGLTASYCLANKGYDVTIFEALDVLGGAMAVYIPEYRLPKDILKVDIENIKRSGVKIKTKTRIGKDMPFKELLDNYKAVFIATGAHKSRKLHIQNEQAKGVIEAMEFLKNVNLEKQAKIGKCIGIIGGGNAAIDAARAAFRIKDCRKIIIIYRRTRAEMPAFKEEVDAALEEGIQIQFLSAPTKIITKDGKVAGVECIKMELGEVDEGGRRKPLPAKGSEFVIDLDTLIVAVGEEPDLGFLGKGDNIKLSRIKKIEVDPRTLATNIPGVFAGGDVVAGPNTVIDAISSGKKVAAMIDKYIQGQSLAMEYKLTRPTRYMTPLELTEEEIEDSKRLPVPSLPINKRISNFNEVELGISEEMAKKEARRCLRCDLETEDGKRCLKETDKGRKSLR